MIVISHPPMHLSSMAPGQWCGGSGGYESHLKSRVVAQEQTGLRASGSPLRAALDVT